MDHLPENQWATTMNLIDSNQDGKISLGEFQEYTNKQQATQGDNRAQIEMGLEALDLNQDGNLERVDSNKILYILTSISVIRLIFYS